MSPYILRPLEFVRTILAVDRNLELLVDARVRPSRLRKVDVLPDAYFKKLLKSFLNLINLVVGLRFDFCFLERFLILLCSTSRSFLLPSGLDLG